VANPIKYVSLLVTHYVLPPNQPSVGAAYYSNFTHPLQSQASEQWNPNQPTWTPTATRTSTVTSTPTVTRTPTRTLTPTPTPTASRTSTPTRTATVTPTPQPALAVSPSQLTFLTGPGLQPVTQAVRVANTGGSALTWTATESASWLTIAPASGSAGAGGTSTINVSVAPGAAGGFQADITVSAGAGTLNSPQKVRVTLSNQSSLRRIFLPIIVSNG
jgi:hypothetical protein